MCEPELHPLTVYMKLRKRVRLPRNYPILLGHIANIVTNTEKESQLQKLVIKEPTANDGNVLMVDMVQIVSRIQSLHPNVQIEHFGDPQTIVEYTGSQKQPWFVFVLFIWCLLFVGSGLAIMNFHADVNMQEVHQKIFYLITGEIKEQPLLLQIPYSLGIGVGMILFFNRVFRKRLNDEPNPLELEMFMYQENVNQYVISEEYSRKNNVKNSPNR